MPCCAVDGWTPHLPWSSHSKTPKGQEHSIVLAARCLQSYGSRRLQLDEHHTRHRLQLRLTKQTRVFKVTRSQKVTGHGTTGRATIYRIPSFMDIAHSSIPKRIHMAFDIVKSWDLVTKFLFVRKDKHGLQSRDTRHSIFLSVSRECHASARSESQPICASMSLKTDEESYHSRQYICSKFLKYSAL